MPSSNPTQHPTTVNETNDAATDNFIDPLYANLTYGAIYTTDITKVSIHSFFFLLFYIFTSMSISGNIYWHVTLRGLSQRHRRYHLGF